MSIPGSAAPFLLAQQPAEATPYLIERSLRFNAGDSAFLSRTPASAGNRKTWTWAGWVKRSALGVKQQIFGVTGTSNADYCENYFGSDDKLYLRYGYTTVGEVVTTQLFRDVSAWYHIVFVFDVTQATASNRLRLYVNGIKVTAFSTDTRSNLTNNDWAVNRTATHYISGAPNGSGASEGVSGYLADIHFLDGKTPSTTTDDANGSVTGIPNAEYLTNFGEFDSDTGIWSPIAYTGFGDNPNNNTTWSNNWTASGNGFGSQPPSNAFDGNFSTYMNNSNGGQVVTWNTSSYGLSGSLRIYAYSSSGLYDVYVNGTKAADTGSTAAWIDCGSHGTINEIQFAGTTYNTSDGLGLAGILLYAVEVNGYLLLNNSLDNSFHLPFDDNSTDAALGTDTSGKGNNWTPNNLAVSATGNIYSSTWTYSGTGSPSGVQDPTDAFLVNSPTIPDNSQSSGRRAYVNHNGGTSWLQLNPSTALSGSSLRVFTYQPQGTSGADTWINVNGGSNLRPWRVSANYTGWSNAVSIPGGSLTSLRVSLSYGGGSTISIYAIEIDGVILRETYGGDIDSLVDVPTNGTETDSGLGAEVRGNYATWNPLISATNLTNGNLSIVQPSSTAASRYSTIGMSSGKWYWEINVKKYANTVFGVRTPGGGTLETPYDSTGYGLGWRVSGGFFIGGSNTTGSMTLAAGDVLGLGFDADAGTLAFYKNGSLVRTLTAASSYIGETWFAGSQDSVGSNSDHDVNFGQRPFVYNISTGVSSATGGIPILNTSDDYGKTLSSGTKTDSNSANLVLALPMNGSSGGTTFTDYSATIKGSGSAKTATANGNTQTTTTQSKWYGSSAAFDGAGDYLSIPDSSDFDFGTGDYTIEAWLYTTAFVGSNGSAMRFYAQSTGGGGGGSGLSITVVDSTGYIRPDANGTTILTTNRPIALYGWSHCAVVRSAGTTTVYIDGIAAGSSTTSYTVASSSPVLIGAEVAGGGYYNGYIQDLRVYKGVAKYTANFTPPGSALYKVLCTANLPEPTIQDGSKQMGVALYQGNSTDNRAITGLGFSPDLVWFGPRSQSGQDKVISDIVRGAKAAIFSNQIYGEASPALYGSVGSFDTNGFTIKKGIDAVNGLNQVNLTSQTYAAWAWNAGHPSTASTGGVRLDGTGDYLSVASSSDFQLWNSTAWTIEGWIYMHALSGANFFGIGNRATTTTRMLLSFNSSGNLVLDWDGTSSDTSTTFAFGAKARQWYHFAIVSDGSTARVYKDGTLLTGSAVLGTSTQANCPLYIGVYGTASNPAAYNGLNGHLSNFRIIKGTALYTSSFTPSTTPLTNVTNTKLLCCQSATSAAAAAVSPNISGVNDGTVWSDNVTFTGNVYSGGNYIFKPEYAFDGVAVNSSNYDTNGMGPFSPGTVTFNFDGSFSGNLKVQGRLHTGDTITVNGSVISNPGDNSYSVFNLGSVSNLTSLSITGSVGNVSFIGQILFDDVVLVNPVVKAGDATATAYNPLDAFSVNGVGYPTASAASITQGSIPLTGASVNTSAGFSIVSYRTNTSSTNQTIGHGLGVKPELILIKSRNQGYNWDIYHGGISNAKDGRLIFTSATFTTAVAPFGGVDPTSSVFTMRQVDYGNDVDCVAYSFAPVEGYSTFGSYIGSTSLPFVYTGFRPKWLLIKPTNLASNWYIYDSARGAYNTIINPLLADTNAQEATAAGNNDIDFLSNGFRVRGVSNSGTNYTSINFVYFAFAESPFALNSRAR